MTAAAPASGTPTGQVSFYDGGGTTWLGTAFLDAAGQATLITSPSSLGSHSLVAAYDGDGNFKTSTSPLLTHTVNRPATTTAITSSGNPAVIGQAVTFTVTVSPVGPATGTPTGQVQFTLDGLNVAAPVSLTGGIATSSAMYLSAGAHTITAVYGGDGGFLGSTSGAFVQTVSQPSTPASSLAIPAIQWPSGLAFDGTSLYVSTIGGARDVYRLDPFTGAILGTIPLGGDPRDLVFDGAGHLFASDVGGVWTTEAPLPTGRWGAAKNLPDCPQTG